MKAWEKFEYDCLKYLCNKFKNYATFEKIGGFNSSVPDIKVVTKANKEFFIEVKHSPSQCGQFVLTPNRKKKQFVFSLQNTSKLTSNTQTIIEYMNNNFDTFIKSGTKGTDIIFNSCDKVFTNWVVEYYKSKNAILMISNGFIVLPINKFKNYFNITGTYRIKKSGSSNVPATYKNTVIKYLLSLKLKDFKYCYNNAHLNVFTSENIDKKKFKINASTFMFSKRNNCYEIRKLSNTRNSNVIFSINLKNNVKGISDKEFIDYLTQ